jgi:hypothetical protein
MQIAGKLKNQNRNETGESNSNSRYEKILLNIK